MTDQPIKQITDKISILPYKTGDVLLFRDEDNQIYLYAVDDIERALYGSSHNEQSITLYDPVINDYFVENSNSRLMKSMVGVIDGTLPDNTDDQLSVELEPVTILNDNSLLRCQGMEPDAYAVKFAGNVRGLFMDTETADVYVHILEKAEQEGGIVPYVTSLDEWRDIFNHKQNPETILENF